MRYRGGTAFNILKCERKFPTWDTSILHKRCTVKEKDVTFYETEKWCHSLRDAREALKDFQSAAKLLIDDKGDKYMLVTEYHIQETVYGDGVMNDAMDAVDFKDWDYSPIQVVES